MRNDTLDAIQAIGLLLAVAWPCFRALLHMVERTFSGAGIPEIPSPFRKDTPEELRFRKIILVALLCGFLFCVIVLALPSIPGVKDKRLYSIGAPVYLGLSIWHALYLKGIVKRRTLWPGYIDPNTRENRVKEILVLRAHERGEPIPTVEEVQAAARMPEAEFEKWLAEN